MPTRPHEARFFAAVAALLLTGAPTAVASILRLETTLGDIDVRLFESATPESVQNFLNYVADDDLDGSFFHRAPKQFRLDDQGQPVLDTDGQPIIDTFVLQGGGFRFTDAAGLSSVPTDPPVINEPGLTNLPGTIAYAKQGGNPNSATSGFFFNTSDKAANLDAQNGGFTVFARVVRGADVLEAITNLDVFDVDGPGQTFDTTPLLNIPGSFEQNFIYLDDVFLLDLPDGDYDFDGDVDTDDYQVWRAQFGFSLHIADHQAGSPLTFSDADGNGDGRVDAADYTIWRNAFAESSAPAATATPEPAAATLLVLACLAIGRRCR